MEDGTDGRLDDVLSGFLAHLIKVRPSFGGIMGKVRVHFVM